MTKTPPKIHPTDLHLVHAKQIAVDTETSGLFVDEGARISTVSIAWIDETNQYAEYDGQTIWDSGICTIRNETIHPDLPKVRVVSAAWPFDQGVNGTGKTEDHGQDSLWPDATNLPQTQWDTLLAWLTERDLVMHNAKFDVHMFHAGCRRWPGRGVDLLEQVTWDTQNGNALLYPTQVLQRGTAGIMRPTTSLKPVAAWLWGEAESDEQQIIKKYLTSAKLPTGRWDLMPWDTIARYADQDARLTIRLYRRQIHDLTTGQHGAWLGGPDAIIANLERRLEVTKMLTRMERRGLPFDSDGARKASREIAKRIHKAEAQLPFQPPTLPMAKHYWFGTGEHKGVTGLGLPPYETTSNGEPALTQQIVDEMVKDGVAHASLWRDVQKLRTADSRWYAGYASMVGADGRLRASVRQNGTVSSRFSVERVQLQAIPHDYRLSEFSALEGIPTPRDLIGAGVPTGTVLWEMDLINAEARVAALMAKDRKMLDLINSGADLHGETARALFGIDPRSAQWNEMRQVGKRCNFGLVFGVGWQTLQSDIAQQTGITFSEAQTRKIVKDWNELYPGFRRAIYKHMEVVEQRQRKYGYGWVQVANGERRWFQAGEQAHKAFNQRVQMSLAQFGIDWWLYIERACRNLVGDDPVTLEVDGRQVYAGRLGLVLMTHDSADLLLPDDNASERLVADIQQFGARLWSQWFPGVPGGVDVKRWGH